MNQSKKCSSHKSVSSGRGRGEREKLPVYVKPLNPTDAPVCVRLRKFKGKVYQDADVYIGDRSKSWGLRKSVWDNPFTCLIDEDGGDPTRSHAMYKRYVQQSPFLRDLLPSLLGCRLGSFCEDQSHSHGHVLAELIDDQLVTQPDDGSSASRYHHSRGGRRYFRENERCVYFAGARCPLSNLYPCKIEYNGWTFLSSYHLLTFLKAFETNYSLARKIRSSSEHSEITELDKQLPTVRAERLIALLHCALVEKYKQVTEFRVICNRVVSGEKLVLECTKSKFWGIGEYFQSTSFDRSPVSVAIGMNVNGWTILCAALTVSEKEATFEKLINLYTSSGCNRDSPLYRGLILVLQNVASEKLLREKLSEQEFTTVNKKKKRSEDSKRDLKCTAIKPDHRVIMRRQQR